MHQVCSYSMKITHIYPLYTRKFRHQLACLRLNAPTLLWLLSLSLSNLSPWHISTYPHTTIQISTRHYTLSLLLHPMCSSFAFQAYKPSQALLSIVCSKKNIKELYKTCSSYVYSKSDLKLPSIETICFVGQSILAAIGIFNFFSIECKILG